VVAIKFQSSKWEPDARYEPEPRTEPAPRTEPEPRSEPNKNKESVKCPFCGYLLLYAKEPQKSNIRCTNCGKVFQA
jgi:hypothetical protein